MAGTIRRKRQAAREDVLDGDAEPGGRDSMRQYLKDISGYPLLSAEAERHYGRRAREGDSEALQMLIRTNLRFVVFVAGYFKRPGRTMMELVADGNLGLCLAAERFDPDKNARFITYASAWIRSEIQDGLRRNAFAVRTAKGQQQRLRRISELQQTAMSRLGRQLDTQELAQGLDISDDAVRNTLQHQPHGERRLDAPVRDGNHTTFAEQLAADAPSDGREEADEMAWVLRELIGAAVTHSRERACLLLKHNLVHFTTPLELAHLIAKERAGSSGLECSASNWEELQIRAQRAYGQARARGGLTLDEVGEALGVTRERARQLTERAKERLASLCSDMQRFRNVVATLEGNAVAIADTGTATDRALAARLSLRLVSEPRARAAVLLHLGSNDRDALPAISPLIDCDACDAEPRLASLEFGLALSEVAVVLGVSTAVARRLVTCALEQLAARCARLGEFGGGFRPVEQVDAERRERVTRLENSEAVQHARVAAAARQERRAAALRGLSRPPREHAIPIEICGAPSLVRPRPGQERERVGRVNRERAPTAVDACAPVAVPVGQGYRPPRSKSRPAAAAGECMTPRGRTGARTSATVPLSLLARDLSSITVATRSVAGS